MTNKLIQLIPFIKEDKQQEILKRLTEVSKLYDSLKAEFNKPDDKKILDMIVGNKPIIQYLQSDKCKKKENGELLLGNKDLSAFIDALKSLTQNETSTEKYMKKYIIDLSVGKSETQRLIQLLERIEQLLKKIEDFYIQLVILLFEERKQLYKISNN